MEQKFSFYDVSSGGIMDVAKLLGTSPSSLTIDNIVLSFEGRYAKSTIQQILSVCTQLGLIDKIDNNYSINHKARDNVKRANKEDLNVVFRSFLQNYPPFLIYADFLSKGYSSVESATMTRGLFCTSSPPKLVEKCLRTWGMNSGLIIQDGEHLVIPGAEKGLPSEYVKDLMKSLDNDLKAKMFIINTIGPEVYSCITNWGLDISDLSNALLNYEVDSKNSLDKVGQFFESFLHSFGNNVPTPISLVGVNGVNQAVDMLFQARSILKNQKHIGNGIGGLRNIAAHGVDSETQQSWNVTPSAALAGILLVLPTIKSYYQFLNSRTQEI